MGHFTDSLENRKRLQRSLIALNYDLGPTKDDGKLGTRTADAIKDFRKKNGLSEVAVIDPDVLRLLNLTPEPIVQLPNIGASLADYFLNFITSKINWAAIALVGFAVTWINTRFGIQVPAEIQNTVTGLLVTGGGALIVLLRTFFNAPKVVTKMPETITAAGATKP